MPIYEPDHIEYQVTSGRITIVMEDGSQLPAYWAHPQLGAEFPGTVVIHDWWGLNTIVRRVANLFAQMGHYVIVPDLFNGKLATTAPEAMRLVEGLGDDGYRYVHTALEALENHHQCNRRVAAVGLGMGGSMAFEAAITRDDLEVAVTYGGFPDRYLGRFKDANTRICAFYGEDEQYIKHKHIGQLRKELAASPLPHELHVVEGLAHDFFSEDFSGEMREHSRFVLKKTLAFLDKHLEHPTGLSDRQIY